MNGHKILTFSSSFFYLRSFHISDIRRNKKEEDLFFRSGGFL